MSLLWILGLIYTLIKRYKCQPIYPAGMQKYPDEQRCIQIVTPRNSDMGLTPVVALFTFSISHLLKSDSREKQRENNRSCFHQTFQIMKLLYINV